MRRKAGLNRAILDQGWADFVRCLEAKIEEVGRRSRPRGPVRHQPAVPGLRSSRSEAVPPARAPMPGLRARGGSRRRRRTSRCQPGGPDAQRLGREPGGGCASGRADEAGSSRFAEWREGRESSLVDGLLREPKCSRAGGRGAGRVLRVARTLIETLVKHAALRLRRLVENDHVSVHSGAATSPGSSPCSRCRSASDSMSSSTRWAASLRLAASSEEQQADRRRVRVLGVGERAHGAVLLARLTRKPITDRRLARSTRRRRQGRSGWRPATEGTRKTVRR